MFFNFIKTIGIFIGLFGIWLLLYFVLPLQLRNYLINMIDKLFGYVEKLVIRLREFNLNRRIGRAKKTTISSLKFIYYIERVCHYILVAVALLVNLAIVGRIWSYSTEEGRLLARAFLLFWVAYHIFIIIKELFYTEMDKKVATGPSYELHNYLHSFFGASVTSSFISLIGQSIHFIENNVAKDIIYLATMGAVYYFIRFIMRTMSNYLYRKISLVVTWLAYFGKIHGVPAGSYPFNKSERVLHLPEQELGAALIENIDTDAIQLNVIQEINHIYDNMQTSQYQLTVTIQGIPARWNSYLIEETVSLPVSSWRTPYAAISI
ncbi:hypothetical protein ACTGWL_05060 [Streptococcus suis]